MIPEKKLDNNEMEKVFKNPLSLKETNKFCTLDDDLIKYIDKSLLWVESTGLELKKESGLPYNAPAIIDANNIIKLKDIFIAWKQIFENAPETIKEFVYYDGDEEKATYKHSSKKQFITELEDAIELLDEAQKNNNYILTMLDVDEFKKGMGIEIYKL